ncbi:MAG TPA: RdgB/HAM1 family non-canonical purine NTP pyrophosphatase [Thermomicrobiales bacterium]|nr:RdgB/HAM1 family non-canonical purine NTP pyrophosphatase [Thermomicrobiales bacterium]
MPRLLIATGNTGKIAEMEALIGDRAEVISLAEAGIESPEETGTTFEENAALKAVNAARESGLVTVADDSGIEVDALGGAPGVRSVRYAGDDATDEQNIAKLLHELEGVPDEARTAGFVSVIVVATPDGRARAFRGTLEGMVGRSPRGGGGFGYDPVMVLGDGRTVAELEPGEKNGISHRGTALRNALPYIHELLDSGA